MINTEKITDYLNSAIERKIFSGCALGWVADGRESVVTAGRYTYEDDAPPVTERSLFDCASVTKAIPVSCLAMFLIDRGELGIDDRLIKYVPEYRGSFRDDITIRHLLTHTLDFDFRLSEYKDLPAERLIDSIISVKMKSPPGEKFCYANATSILLGMVIEAVWKKPLHVMAKEVFFDPLGMSDTTFFPDDVARCVPTETDPWRGRVVRGEVHDESAWALRPIMTAGSAGMFSTAPDIMRFIKMLLVKSSSLYGDPLRGSLSGACRPRNAPALYQNQGADKEKVFFSSEMIRSMHTDQIPHIPVQSTGLGWELNQEYMGASRSASTFGKTGFTGCAVIIDPTKNAGLVLLSNYTWPTRKPNRDLINEVRANIADLVFGSP